MKNTESELFFEKYLNSINKKFEKNIDVDGGEVDFYLKDDDLFIEVKQIDHFDKKSKTYKKINTDEDYDFSDVNEVLLIKKKIKEAKDQYKKKESVKNLLIVVQNNTGFEDFSINDLFEACFGGYDGLGELWKDKGCFVSAVCSISSIKEFTSLNDSDSDDIKCTAILNPFSKQDSSNFFNEKDDVYEVDKEGQSFRLI